MVKVLFVCMGNICRSPAAEGIFKKLVSEAKLEEEILVDSAGTIGYHSGELPDPRMRKQAAIYGYELDSRARQFNPNKDFEEFDYIITMDNDNYSEIKRLDKKHLFNQKIFKMADFIPDKNIEEVPDPYYGDKDDFDFVIKLLEDGTKNLLTKIRSNFD